MFNLGVDRRETLRLIAKSFFFGLPEYASRARTDSQFVDDLYQAFFQRAPSANDRNYWLGHMAGGLNREAVALNFMFSAEFQLFMNNILGAFVQRPETALTIDIFRGALTRLPESTGFDYWRGRIRSAQCSSTDRTVRLNNVAAESSFMVNFFFHTDEYVNHGRNNGQFIADLYDVFLRRGPEVEGFSYWVGQINTSARTRDGVIDAFLAGVEWGARVNELTDAGCVQ